LNNGWDRGQGDGDNRIVNPTAVESTGGGSVAFSGKIQVDVSLPGQDCSFVTLEIVRTHVRIQVAPVVVGGSKIVVATAVVRGIVMVADRSDV